LIIGLLSILLSLKVTSIVQSLLIALTFFSGAFILPVLAGLLGFRNNRLRSNLAILAGGLVALTGKILTMNGSSKLGNLLILCAFAINALLLFPGGKWDRSQLFRVRVKQTT